MQNDIKVPVAVETSPQNPEVTTEASQPAQATTQTSIAPPASAIPVAKQSKQSKAQKSPTATLPVVLAFFIFLGLAFCAYLATKGL